MGNRPMSWARPAETPAVPTYGNSIMETSPSSARISLPSTEIVFPKAFQWTRVKAW